ncbi:MAG: DGQHR domain-containing protein DpdB [Rhodoferax sp.]|nr:DGQHR domain-containing protein DpdB [Rhodoferax sp.]MDP3651672.1 DGQHR domain-containing protein DpdB [Rhodoferax sp.]
MQKSKKPTEPEVIRVSAIQFEQGDHKLYTFALSGGKIAQIADFSRLKKGESGELLGFQRKEIQQHVKQIVDYLNQGAMLFPNAIILAISPELKFDKARGSRGANVEPSGQLGYLNLPVGGSERKEAWIVDGQQRSLALAKSKNPELPVPVIAFESMSVDMQRQQFILVNRAKPLSQQLVNELLPVTDETYLPKNLAMNKVPSKLCGLLNESPKSPFYGRIDRKSAKSTRAVGFNDTAIIAMIRERINTPLGALGHLKGFQGEHSDYEAMYKILDAYWCAVSEVFPEAWNLPPSKSRLTHSAGIKAMGSLLDRIASRVDLKQERLKAAFVKELTPMAKACAWTSGRWPYIQMQWNAIEQTHRSVHELTRALTSLYMEVARA